MRFIRNIRLIFLGMVVLVAISFFNPALAQKEKIDLTMRLVSDTYYNSLTAGEEKTLFLEIGNNGNQTIINIQLSAAEPEGWIIEFRPEHTDSLSPGSIQTVDILITPSAKAPRGDVVVTIIAEANETRRVTDIYLRVESASYWVWVGVGVAALVIAGFIIIFVRFGRQ